MNTSTEIIDSWLVEKKKFKIFWKWACLFFFFLRELRWKDWAHFHVCAPNEAESRGQLAEHKDGK